MERRAFIGKSCSACVAVLALGFVSSLAQGCTSLPMTTATADEKTLRASLDKMLESNVMIVRAPQLDSDILLVKNNDEYAALRMMCTHQDQPLTATSSGLYCSAHGSTFDLQGNVTHEPASRPLKQYRTEKVNDEIIIYLQS